MFVPIVLVISLLFANSEYLISYDSFSKYFNLHHQDMIQSEYLYQIEQIKQQEIHCLATNIYFESRGESLQGRKAVGFVTLNRVKSPRFPDTICEVVYQSYKDQHGNPIRNRCQFSWYCDGKSSSIKDLRTFNNIIDEAAYLYENYYVESNIPDITRGSTHFHADYVSPFWNQVYTQVTQIGTHIFYSNGG